MLYKRIEAQHEDIYSNHVFQRADGHNTTTKDVENATFITNALTSRTYTRVVRARLDTNILNAISNQILANNQNECRTYDAMTLTHYVFDIISYFFTAVIYCRG